MVPLGLLILAEAPPSGPLLDGEGGLEHATATTSTPERLLLAGSKRGGHSPHWIWPSGDGEELVVALGDERCWWRRAAGLLAGSGSLQRERWWREGEGGLECAMPSPKEAPHPCWRRGHVPPRHTAPRRATAGVERESEREARSRRLGIGEGEAARWVRERQLGGRGRQTEW